MMVSAPERAAKDVVDLFHCFLGGKDGIVVVFEVYLDESGTHDGSPVITVAAYLARPDQWAAFTQEWVQAISPAQVYHATDAANCRGEFDGWTPDQVAEVAKKALPLIPKHTLSAFAIGIHMDDYRVALKDKPEVRKALGEPYGCCLQWLLSNILRAKAEAGNRERIAFVHEENDYGMEAHTVYQYLRGIWDVEHITSFAFGSKKHVVPLQAADIYAYEANKRLRAGRDKPNRRALDALLPDKSKASLKYLNRDNLPTMIERVERALQMSPEDVDMWAWRSGVLNE